MFIQDIESTNGVYIGDSEIRLRSMYNYQLMNNQSVSIGPIKCLLQLLNEQQNQLTVHLFSKSNAVND